MPLQWHLGPPYRWQNRQLPLPVEIGTKNQNFLENLKSVALFRVINFLQMTVYLSIWHSHCTRARFTVWCDAVMSLQFTHVHSFACRCKLRNWKADCFTVGLYCITIQYHSNKSSKIYFNSR